MVVILCWKTYYTHTWCIVVYTRWYKRFVVFSVVNSQSTDKVSWHTVKHDALWNWLLRMRVLASSMLRLTPPLDLSYCASELGLRIDDICQRNDHVTLYKLSIFITHDVMFHCFQFPLQNKSVRYVVNMVKLKLTACGL